MGGRADRGFDLLLGAAAASLVVEDVGLAAVPTRDAIHGRMREALAAHASRTGRADRPARRTGRAGPGARRAVVPGGGGGARDLPRSTGAAARSPASAAPSAPATTAAIAPGRSRSTCSRTFASSIHATAQSGPFLGPGRATRCRASGSRPTWRRRRARSRNDLVAHDAGAARCRQVGDRGRDPVAAIDEPRRGRRLGRRGDRAPRPSP